MPELPKICSKTKCHVEGQVVRAPFKHQGQMCTFARHNLRSMRCDLCTGDDKAASMLGKQRQREIILLKIRWLQEEDQEQQENLMLQMTTLLKGTIGLGLTVYSNQFVIHTANNLKQNGANLSIDESIDFILRCFVDGSVRGKGQPLTPAERQEYFERLDTDAFYCSHTGMRLQFFRSYMPNMASPDRLVFVNGTSLDYSDPNQVTVRSSWWSNAFFGSESNRDEYIRRLTQPYLNADNNLDFNPQFSEIDGLIHQFLATSPQARNLLHQNSACMVTVTKVQQIFNHIKTPIRIKYVTKKYSVNDFRNWKEVQSLFKAFRSRCVVSGLNGRDFMLSLDRKIPYSSEARRQALGVGKKRKHGKKNKILFF